MKNTHAAVWQRGAERHKAFCCRSTVVVRGKVYLKLSSGQCNSGQFVKDCLVDKILVTTFYQLCYDVKTNKESKESVLEWILMLFFKIRIHNRYKLFMEARVQKQKTCLKQNSRLIWIFWGGEQQSKTSQHSSFTRLVSVLEFIQYNLLSNTSRGLSYCCLTME